MENVMMLSNTLLNKKYQTALVVVGIAAGLGAVGWFGYSWYRVRVEQQAHKAFVESVNDYTAMEKSTQEQPAWHDIGQALANRAQEHKNSVLAPYFLLYQADALLHEGKRENSIEIMNTALEKISKNLPLYYLYALKRALVKIDSNQELLHNEGLKELDELSTNSENPLQDMALYYKGYNAFAAGDAAQAQQVWVQLFAPAYKESLWAQLAQARLQGLA
jgi:hypothetical protein